VIFMASRPIRSSLRRDALDPTVVARDRHILDYAEAGHVRGLELLTEKF